MSLEVTVERPLAPAESVVAVAWVSPHGSDEFALDELDGDKLSPEPDRHENRGAPAATASITLTTPDDVFDLFMGYPVIVDRNHPEVLQRRSERAPVSSGSIDGTVRTDWWCPDSCEDPHACGDDCYREDFECAAAYDRCELVGKEGDPLLKHPWGAVQAVATDWLVLYAERAIPQDALDSIGLHLPLGAGYHYLHVSQLKGQALEDSKQCWRAASAAALAWLNEDAGTAFSDVDDLWENGSPEDGASHGSRAEQIGLTELQCPVPHFGFESREEARVHFETEPLGRPLFDYFEAIDGPHGIDTYSAQL